MKPANKNGQDNINYTILFWVVFYAPPIIFILLNLRKLQTINRNAFYQTKNLDQQYNSLLKKESKQLESIGKAILELLDQLRSKNIPIPGSIQDQINEVFEAPMQRLGYWQKGAPTSAYQDAIENLSKFLDHRDALAETILKQLDDLAPLEEGSRKTQYSS